MKARELEGLLVEVKARRAAQGSSGTRTTNISCIHSTKIIKWNLIADPAGYRVIPVEFRFNKLGFGVWGLESDVCSFQSVVCSVHWDEPCSQSQTHYPSEEISLLPTAFECHENSSLFMSVPFCAILSTHLPLRVPPRSHCQQFTVSDVMACISP